MNEHVKEQAGSIKLDMPASICAAMAEVRRLSKADRNEFAKYNFTSVDDFKDAIRPILAKHGLYVHVNQVAFEMREYKDERDKAKSVAQFDFDITLRHVSAQSESPERMTVALPFTGAQTSGAARSYALKEWLKSRFMMSSGDMEAEADILSKDEGGMRLSKAEARDTFKALKDELDKVAGEGSHDKVGEWWNENEYRIKVLPQDWFLQFRADALAIHKELKTKAALNAASDEQPEQTSTETADEILDRAWTDLANTETPEDLEDAWTEYAHLVETLSPEDAKRLTDLYDKRLQELEPNPLRGG